ncbi:hypothetical protein N7444_007071 [Penicillium canescens]|nr:hypothetical protein N7444_007071 [Penicillium canescens]KAJ6183575.1 hypothetical protein N7485_002217 [Penicillium canescens]
MDNTFQPEDSGNPRNWPIWKKTIISIIVMFTAFSMSVSNSIYIPTVPYIMEQFHVTNSVALLPMTVYNVGLALGPIFGALSESYGRRIMYIASITGALVFTVVGASTTTFYVIVLTRFLASLCGAPMTTVAMGTLNDVWDAKISRVGAILNFLLTSIAIWGTEIGSPIGEFILTQVHDWRWIFRSIAILFSICGLVWLCPETHGSEIIRRRRRKYRLPGEREDGRTRRLGSNLCLAISQPLHMALVEPLILSTSLVSSFALSVVFFFYVGFPLTYSATYPFSPYQTSLAYLSMFIGSLVAFFANILIYEVFYPNANIEAERSGQLIDPDRLLYPVIAGGILMPLGLFWFAWTINRTIHWIVPLLARLPLGAAYFMISVSGIYFPLFIYYYSKT